MKSIAVILMLLFATVSKGQEVFESFDRTKYEQMNFLERTYPNWLTSYDEDGDIVLKGNGLVTFYIYNGDAQLDDVVVHCLTREQQEEWATMVTENCVFLQTVEEDGVTVYWYEIGDFYNIMRVDDHLIITIKPKKP